MYIQRLIKDLFENYDSTLHDKNGKTVPKETVVTEYRAIRAHIEKNASPGEVMAILLDYDYRFLLCIYACMETGVVFLPLRNSWPKARIDQIKKLTNFKTAIDEETIPSILAQPIHEEPKNRHLKGEAPLYIICTSGTTGEPKGVVIQRRAYENFVKWIDNTFTHMNQQYRWLMTPDFSVDMSLTDSAIFLLKRCELFFSQFAGNLFQLGHEITAHKINGLNTVPNNFNMLVSPAISGRTDLASLCDLFVAGSRFSYGAYKNIFAFFGRTANVYNMYGPTEITVLSHYKKLSGIEDDDVVDANVSIGKPFDGVENLLIDERGNEITIPKLEGELLLGGVQVMKGYIGRPQQTAEALTTLHGTSYYRSGDIAFFDERGDFYITGRKDHTLKRRGYRVNLLDIDSYIQKIDSVQDCTTIAIPDEEKDNILVSYVILRCPITYNELLSELENILVSYQIPDHIEFIDSYPTNNAGKVDRKALHDRWKKNGRP